MTEPRRALPFRILPLAAVLLGVVVAGCGILPGAPDPDTGPTTTSAPSPVAVAPTDAPAPAATERPRRGRRADAEPIPTERPRRGRATPDATPEPTPDPTPRPTAMPAIAGFDAIAGGDGRFTILILGSDARRNLVGERTDAIMVATIDPTTGRVAMASLPRDTVNVPIGPGRTFASPNRINGLLQAFELDGAERAEALRKMRKAIAYAFDIEIDGYALVGFRGLERLVDRIGGVTVTLDAPLVDPTMHLSKRGLRLKAGPNALAGNEALAFSRTRHSDSDYQRVARQQQLIAAIGRKVVENGADALPALAEYALTQVETDLPLSALPVLAELGARARWKTFRSIVLGPSTFAGPGPLLYTIALRLDPVRATMDRLFGPVR